MSELDLFPLFTRTLRKAGDSSGNFIHAGAASISLEVSKLLALAEKGLSQLGFRAVEAVTTTEAPRVVMQGSCRQEDDTWAVFHTDRSGLGWLELFSWFPGEDAALLTSQLGALRDEPSKHRFRSRCHGLDVLAVVEAHDRRKHTLNASFGSALPVDESPRGFRRAIEHSVARGLWG